MERQKGERCGIDNCRSRFYHLADGQWTCSNGHVQEGRLDIREDEEYQPRKGDRRIVEQDDSQVVEERVFTGKKGLSLFLQAFQLILRKQVSWLINEKKFPEEFQLLVRDLWTLRLEVIYSDRSSRGPSSSGYTSQSSAGAESDFEATQASDHNETQSQGSAMSISRSHSQATSRSRSTSRGRRSIRSKDPLPKLIDTITILYIAALLFRMPLEITTVHRWITEQDVIYFRAISHLPAEMLAKMETKWKRKFEPKMLPTAEAVRRAVYMGIRYYNDRFGVVVPRIAAEPLMLGWILGLGCPPEVYPAVFQLAKMIELDLVYNVSASELRTWDYPDVQLMALLVISLKLCFELDDDDISVRRRSRGSKRKAHLPRVPEKEWEIANMTTDWEAWKEILEMKVTDLKEVDEEVENEEEEEEEQEKLEVEKEKRENNWQLGVEEGEIYGWSNQEMDDYLDWFEKNWATEKEGKPTAGVINLFEPDEPVEKIAEGAKKVHKETGSEMRNRLLGKQIQAFMQMQGKATIEAIPAAREGKRKKFSRPGEEYRRYRKWEDINSNKLKTIYTAAAERVGISVEIFAYVVQKLEYRISLVVKGRSLDHLGDETDVEDIANIQQEEEDSDSEEGLDPEEDLEEQEVKDDLLMA